MTNTFEKLKIILKRKSVKSIIMKVVLIWFLITFIIYPNVNLLLNVFVKDEQVTFEAFGKVWQSSRAMKSLINSFILAVSLVITVNFVGILIVLFSEYFEIKGAKILRLGYMSTLVYGGIVLVNAYGVLYGNGGVLTRALIKVIPNMNPNWFEGYIAVMFVMTFSVTSNHMIFLRNAIRGLDYHVIEAAKSMGASASQIFMTVVLPILKPTILAVTVLTFLSGLGALSAPLLVGGVNFQTINPMIMMFSRMATSRDIAALLAIILGLITMVMLIVFNKVEEGGNYISISKTKSKMQKQKINNPIANVLAHVVAYVLFIIYVTPVVMVILYSLSDSLAIITGNISFNSFTFDNFRRLFTESSAYKPYLVSAIYGILASVIATAIALFVSRIIQKKKSVVNTFLEYGMLIPWLLPGTLIALGLMLTYDSPRALIGNKVLIGTTVLLLIGYIIIKLPFSFRMIRSSLFSIEGSLEEAAQNMGASKFYTLRRVVLPIILPFPCGILTGRCIHY